MSEPQEPQGGSGEESAQPKNPNPGDQPITASTLQRVLKTQFDSLHRSLDEKIGNAVKQAQESMREEFGSEGKPDDDSEASKTELEKERKARQKIEARLEAYEQKIADQEAAAKRQAKRNAITEALRHKDSGCVEVDVVAAHLDPIVQENDEGGHFVEHDAGDGMGAQQLSVVDFITKVYKSERPSLFEQATREGPGARGRTGTPGAAKYDYQKARNDPSILLSDDFRKALAEGKVANYG